LANALLAIGLRTRNVPVKKIVRFRQLVVRRCPRKGEDRRRLWLISKRKGAVRAHYPVMLDYLVPADHICRVVDAFVEQFDMENPEFGRAEPLIRVGVATILAIC
jgi:hypothetical protein